jgi:hypothetical protein
MAYEGLMHPYAHESPMIQIGREELGIVTVECEVAEQAIGPEVKARRRRNSRIIRRRRNAEIGFDGRSGAFHSTGFQAPFWVEVRVA